MELLRPVSISCPYCGESLELSIDCSIEQQHYIEDCQVCCRPIELTVGVDAEGEAYAVARHEND